MALPVIQVSTPTSSRGSCDSSRPKDDASSAASTDACCLPTDAEAVLAAQQFDACGCEIRVPEPGEPVARLHEVREIQLAAAEHGSADTRGFPFGVALRSAKRFERGCRYAAALRACSTFS